MELFDKKASMKQKVQGGFRWPGLQPSHETFPTSELTSNLESSAKWIILDFNMVLRSLPLS